MAYCVTGSPYPAVAKPGNKMKPAFSYVPKSETTKLTGIATICFTRPGWECSSSKMLLSSLGSDALVLGN